MLKIFKKMISGSAAEVSRISSQASPKPTPTRRSKRAVQLPKTLDLIRWLIVDIYRFFKNGRQAHLFGIWCYVGIYGGGKTMSLVHYLERMRERWGERIYICTNFFYKGEDFSLENWRDILKDYDRPVIFAYDELQNEFNSRDYRNFPIPLMGELTQNRKGFGKQIVYTTQNFDTVDKNFRNLTTQVAACRTYFGRLTRCKYYKREYYENLVSTISIERKFRIKPLRVDSFVQSDYLRSQYDSYARLKSVRQL
ncbi:MAG: hypothetical protein LBR98_10330, partial [Syntrophomonadaceae bacterium]|nr:hypothetical protein [Syntrophomonadaceae bacterium]